MPDSERVKKSNVELNFRVASLFLSSTFYFTIYGAKPYLHHESNFLPLSCILSLEASKTNKTRNQRKKIAILKIIKLS